MLFKTFFAASVYISVPFSEEVLLWNTNLGGTIPNVLSQLRNLTRLDLSNNRLSGSIPSSISALTSLKELSLNDNELIGTIPVEIGLMQNLQTLLLDRNLLNGKISHKICRLFYNRDLKKIEIDCNKIECACCTQCL